MNLIDDTKLKVGDTFRQGLRMGSKQKFNLIQLPIDTVWTVTRENKATFSISTKGTNLYLTKTGRVITR